MYHCVLGLCLVVLLLCVIAQQPPVTTGSFQNEKNHDVLSDEQIKTLASLANTNHINDALDNICIARGAGTSGHTRVKEYLKNSMKNLNWTVETDAFNENTVFGRLKFENIIVKLNPDARRYLALTCHYDTIYTQEGQSSIVGATASAVPCVQLLNLATVMQQQLSPLKTSDVSLMFIFFDGHETMNIGASESPQYGFNHLAAKWNDSKTTYGNERNITELSKLDTMIYLKFLGTSDTLIKYFSTNTRLLYARFRKAEHSLAILGQFDEYFINSHYRSQKLRYFHNNPTDFGYNTFFGNDVTVFYMTFPTSKYNWDKLNDQRNIINMNTVENLNKILRVFVASYLKLNI